MAVVVNGPAEIGRSVATSSHGIRVKFCPSVSHEIVSSTTSHEPTCPDDVISLNATDSMAKRGSTFWVSVNPIT